MHLNLRQLEIFVAVADSGSTAAAGRRIGLSQSAASDALLELETTLDAALFDRIGKRLVINEAGRTLLARARMLLDQAHDIERQFGIGPVGAHGQRLAPRIRLGASTTVGNYLVPDMIANLLRVSPEANVDVYIANTRDVAMAASRLDIDVGLVEGPCHDDALHVEPWRSDELVIVCAPSHPLAQSTRRKPVSIDALKTARWLLREPGSGTRSAVEHALLPHLHHFEHSMQLGGSEAIKRSVAAGVGIACLSRCVVQNLILLGHLRILDTELPALTRHFYLVRHRAKQLSPHIQRLIGLA
ncbi:MAG: LysR family transcriptional regulator [Rhodocyclaceae bacterium]